MNKCKRKCSEDNSGDESCKKMKKAEIDSIKSRIKAIRDDLQPVCKLIEDIELEVAKEQLKVQKRMMSKLLPLYAERDKKITENQGLWGKLIAIHPLVEDNNLMVPTEVNFLINYLEKITLEDLIDDNGSYKLTFYFKEEAQKMFNPIEWTKTVFFDDNNEIIADKCISTDISFIDSKDDPRLTISSMNEKSSDIDDDDNFRLYSITGWFSEANPKIAGMFGDIFRTEIYPHPELLLDDTAVQDSYSASSESNSDNEKVENS